MRDSENKNKKVGENKREEKGAKFRPQGRRRKERNEGRSGRLWEVGSKSSPAPRRTCRSQTSLPLSLFLRPSPSLPLFLFLSFTEPHLLAMV